MTSRRRVRAMWLGAAASVLLAAPAAAQLQPVQPEDYGRFESLGAAVLSPDGQWLAYEVNRVSEENELRVRRASRDTTMALPMARSAQFSGDSRWLAYAITVSASERERLTAEKKPIRSRGALMDLRTGDREEFGDIASYEFSPDGRYLALTGYAPEGSRGRDVIVRDLEAGTSVHFGNVSSSEWAPDGALLALTLETESGTGNALQLYDAVTGALRVLDTSNAAYRHLSWRDDARDLAVLRTVPDSTARDTAHVVIAWTDVNTTDAKRLVLYPDKAAGVAPGMYVAGSRAPAWSADGSVIAIGLRAGRRVPEVSSDSSSADDAAAVDPVLDGKPSDVQVWHARDVRIMPQQKAQEQQDLRRTLLAAWDLRYDRVVPLGTNLQESARLLEIPRYATETDHSRNAFGAMFGRPGQDVWLIDLTSGERTRMLEDVGTYIGASTSGRYLLWFDKGDYWTVDVTTGARTNLTERVDAHFEDREYDFPVDRLPPYGVAGWTEDDRALLVYDRYDVWSLASDGSGGRRLTDGAVERIVHRVESLTPDEDGIDVSRPLYFSLFGERTKQSGWARLRGGSLERLVYEDAELSRLMKADSADAFAFTRSSFDDAPDWFIGSGALRDAQQVTRLNPFQRDYAWGRAELIDFTSTAGLELQGVLLYPAGHDESRQYPMIVYTYEQLSQNLHDYIVPSERSYYNVNVFTANGYFVLLPDIVYRGRDPGVSALEAVVPAVRSVIGRGLVDSTKVGLVGHSWGGYQAAYLPTRTDIFAASVAGAPITNFLSFAGAIHWTPGIAEMSHWETGQARMGVPFWEDMDAYLRNSPAHMVHELNTPMLMMFGDADGTVDWHQGVEFYNFARRAGREDFVLLVYPGEDHGLRKRENQVDYHRRILQWFGHWLKGEPAAKWITEGTTWLERKDALDNPR